MTDSDSLECMLRCFGILDRFVDRLQGSGENKIAAVGHAGFGLLLGEQSAPDICDYDSGVERTQIDSDEESGVVAKPERNGLSSQSTRVVPGFYDQPLADKTLDDRSDGRCTEAGLPGQLRPRNVTLGVNELQNIPFVLERLGFGIASPGPL